MTKKVIVVATVLLVHTAAAHAQQSANQSGPFPDTGAAAAEAFPPAYAPPPGFKPPASAQPQQQRPYYGPGPTYGAPSAYGAPPAYGASGHYPPPNYYYQYPPIPPRQVLDRPFTLGGGIGFGGLGFKDAVTGRNTADGGMAYTFRLGFGLRPGLLLLWDVEGALVSREGSAVSQTANLIALQLFVSQRLFLKTGFGIAQVIQNNQYATYDSNRLDWGGAAMAGIGYELIQGWNWSFDIEATVTGARYSTNGPDQTWTNWSLVNFAINFF